MTSWHIHIEGRVQGVGFRPFVYGLAHEMNICGTVSNSIDGVHIYFNGTSDIASKFQQSIVNNAPRLSLITNILIEEVSWQSYADFSIIESTSDEQAGTLYLTPDIGLCHDCKLEIGDPFNRRYSYSFTTCTNCGPRFSIASALPYDRPNTTMQSFTMCHECLDEYHDPTNRRHYSQTNSCHNCGLCLTQGANSQPVTIQQIVSAWEQGQIVAIKGVGGYLLTCDASSANTIKLLRERKSRPSKPFASMFASIESLRESAALKSIEEEALLSPEAPIVLVSPKRNITSLALDEIAPRLDRIGAMLPYTPLFQILLNEFGKTIIATSANVTNAPIVFNRHTAFEELNHIADLVVHDDRDIHFPQDDSVISFTPKHAQRIVLRRSRGLAPAFISNKSIDIEQDSIATGAMMKSAFAIAKKQQIRISQYLGDLSQYDTELRFKATFEKMLELDLVQPQGVLTDMHPGYATADMAREFGDRWSVPVIEIQHHEAHFGAILGEHWKELKGKRVLGVIWDGTGLGTDRNIWGGEMFVYDGTKITRAGHLQYCKAMFGDKPSREPRLAALLRCVTVPQCRQYLKPHFNSKEWQLYSTASMRRAPVLSSSMGRLFDTVSALTGICTHQSYEGEAAMLLEVAARSWIDSNRVDHISSYPISISDGVVATDPMIESIVHDLDNGCTGNMIAYRFHLTMVEVIHQFAVLQQVNTIACSGGVFQNSLLVDMILDNLKNDYDIVFHNQLSPNDENIAYGQIVLNAMKEQYNISISQQSSNHVLSNSW